ncbi:hypothetical protein [Roseivirga echinicomitans]|uniref:Class I SAM-dependent methyltransferase n=1 Tax=Roseivirga echinicomitans TaxID=296218 RepID=A0A150X9J4_9BACT|nr:hypothetical protein [Roseivirga echinicomitans]KYG75391.1 hypothetical protein AWN68_07525 [Roseivirga echinicomitans]
MGRIHLFEFEDQKWFPTFLRNYGTDFLQFLSNKTKMYKPIIPIIEKGLKKGETNQIIDLGSGGGGGLIWLNSELKKRIPNLKITLTDYYPNIPAFKLAKKHADNFEYIEKPVDARNVPIDLKGLRTQFLSLHHFRPNDAKQILQNAVNSSSSISIFEAQERSFLSILAMLFSPLTVLLITPFIKPFKLGRIIFTYLIPIVPLFVLWDGVVSSFRTYSLKEMNEFVAGLNGTKNYEWEINKVKSGPSVVLYLLGTKKEN